MLCLLPSQALISRDDTSTEIEAVYAKVRNRILEKESRVNIRQKQRKADETEIKKR